MKAALKHISRMKHFQKIANASQVQTDYLAVASALKRVSAQRNNGAAKCVSCACATAAITVNDHVPCLRMLSHVADTGSYQP
jgi:hypothetical protein